MSPRRSASARAAWTSSSSPERALRPARPAGAQSDRLERRDVDGLGALVPGLSVVRDLRTLGQRLETAGVDAGVVDEKVLPAVIGSDEAEALVVVEPLYGSGRHWRTSYVVPADARDAA